MKSFMYNNHVTLVPKASRCHTGTDLARALGPDRARILMGHDADTRPLERYYIDFVPTTDISAINLGEPESLVDMTKLIDKLAITVMPLERADSLQGVALNVLARNIP
jgi:hypothetical protein